MVGIRTLNARASKGKNHNKQDQVDRKAYKKIQILLQVVTGFFVFKVDLFCFKSII